jgi:hypothetical protein
MPAYDEQPYGLSWTIAEPMARTSHALVDAGRVWLVDPVDDADAISRAAALGEPAGVLQLLDRHNRDSEAVAERLGVERFVVPKELPGTPFEVIEVIDNRLWREVALWWPKRRVLVVPESVGTAQMFTTGSDPVGVHVGLRLKPPRRLAAFAPEHLLVGHGANLHGPQTAAALSDALDHARGGLPKALLKLPGAMRG